MEYKHDSSIEIAYKTYTTIGVTGSNNTSAVSIVQLSTSGNVVKTYGGPYSSTVAIATIWNTPTGHLNRWGGNGNRTAIQNSGTDTHIRTKV